MGLPFLLKQHQSFVFSLLLGIFISYSITLYSNLSSDCFSTDYYAQPINLVNVQSDEYEPHINLAGKPQKAKKVPQNLIRPRYYSSELGIREKLFIGILTSEQTVSTLAVAVNKTSSHLVNKLMFFMDAAGAEKANVITLKLPGIVGFVDTREILKPFHMLKYLTDNFLEEYDFFFLTRDTSYINAKHLMNIVKKISVSHEVHLGGMSKSDAPTYCTLDGGILLSNNVLKKIQSSLDWCVKNAFSDTDDDNVGRCILHASQLPCQSTFQNLNLLSVELTETDKQNFESEHLPAAVTYYKVTEPTLFYRLHLHLAKSYLELQKVQIAELKNSLDISDLAWPPGSYPPKKPQSRFDLLSWQYFDDKNIYLTSDFINLKPLGGADLLDIYNVKNRSIQWLTQKYVGNIQFRRLVNGYRRFDPSRGLDYILDLAFKDSTGRETIKRVEVTKTLGRVEMLQMPYVTENSRVYMLLPILEMDRTMASEFMKQYAQTCSQSDLSFLMLVLLYEPNAPGKGHIADVFKDIKELTLKLSSKYHKDCKITWISIRVPDVGGGPPMLDYLLHFAILDLASKKLAPDSLVLMTEPNMEIRTDYLNRVRMSTINGKQVYSPIPFSEFYPPIAYRNTEKKTVLEIHKNTGRFDLDNQRHISFYLSDYLEGRKLMAHLPVVAMDKDIRQLYSSQGAGYDKPTNLLDMLTRQGLSIIRAVDPALRLRRRNCMPATPFIRPTQYNPCDSPLATRAQLGQLVLDLTGNKSSSSLRHK